MSLRLARILVILAAIMGADGVILAAASAHLADAARLGAASSMLLFHATAVLGALVLSDRGTVNARVGLFAAFGFVTGAGLFAGDLLRRLARHRLGGMTGDVFGAQIELATATVLVAAALTM